MPPTPHILVALPTVIGSCEFLFHATAPAPDILVICLRFVALTISIHTYRVVVLMNRILNTFLTQIEIALSGKRLALTILYYWLLITHIELKTV